MRIRPNSNTIIIKFGYNNRKIGFLSRKKGIRVGREKKNVEVTEKRKRGKAEFDRKIVEKTLIQGKGGVLTL